MDAWISELEMVWNEEPIILSDHQNEEVNTLGEELALVLGEDFSSLCQEENTISSLLNYCAVENPTNLLNQLTTSEDKQLPTFSNNLHPYERTNEYYSPKSIEPTSINKESQKEINSSDEKSTKEISTSDDQQSTKGGKRKRRDPEQVQDHILAERKRRQTLSQQFIALSALVPNLKKVDKTSILEEAIKHLKEMQEKVKSLEVAVSKQTPRAQLVVDDENSSNSSIDNTNACISGDTSDGDQSETVPEIEMKVSNKTVLLRICCARRKGILARISKEIENCHLIILNCSVLTFQTSTLDITIVAQMETEHGYEKHVKNLVRNLNSALRIW
ncbi:hypothetical protein vseg_005213 [Gypsophila vaccaria]